MGNVEDFCPNFSPNVPEKFSGSFVCEIYPQTDHEHLLSGWPTNRKAFHVILHRLSANVSKSNNFGWTPFLPVFLSSLSRFPGILRIPGFFPDFRQIKAFEGVLAPPAPTPPTPLPANKRFMLFVSTNSQRNFSSKNYMQQKTPTIGAAFSRKTQGAVATVVVHEVVARSVVGARQRKAFVNI